MRKLSILWISMMGLITLLGCVSDGIEDNEEYTYSDNTVEKPDTLVDKPKKAQYHFERGLKMAILDKDTIGDWPGAIKELDKAIELNPEFQKAYHYRAIIYSDLQNEEQAFEDINQALKLDDKIIESYFVRASLFANKGDFKNTIKDFDTIIALDPDNGKAYDHRGYAKFELGDKDEGCQDLKKARELGYLESNKEGDKLICK